MKNFDRWNEEKKRINIRFLGKDFFYHPREVWWCALGINIDIETDGKHENFERPILILKKFNEYHFWGIPLTTNEKVGKFYQKITYEGKVSWAMISQIKTLSTKRLLRKIDRIPENEFETIKSKLKNLL